MKYYHTRSPAPLSGCFVVRYRVPPGSTLRALARGMSMRGVSPPPETSGPYYGPREQANAAGDEEPATKSQVSSVPTVLDEDKGDGEEHGLPSTLPKRPLSSGTEPATECSKGVAGAERHQGPTQPAAGRALAASEGGSGQRPGGHCFLQFPPTIKIKKMSRMLRVGSEPTISRCLR